MKLIFICHRVYQSGLGLQAKQMNFGKLKGIYGSAIGLLTEPKGRLAIQVPKMHRIQGQPGSRQNPAPSSTRPEGEGMPPRLPALLTPSLTQRLVALLSSKVWPSFCII